MEVKGDFHRSIPGAASVGERSRNAGKDVLQLIFERRKDGSDSGEKDDRVLNQVAERNNGRIIFLKNLLNIPSRGSHR